MDERAVPPPGPRADLGPLQALGRIARMFYNPRRAAAEIRESPNWVFPLLTTAVLTFLVAVVLFSRPEWQQVLQKNLDANASRLGQLDKVRALALLKVFGWVGAVCVAVIGNLVLAVLLWGAAVLMEGQVTFPAVFSLQLHAQMVTRLQEVCAAGLLLRGGVVDPAAGDVTLPSSLAYYLPSEGVAPALRSLASAVDLFSLWYWGLVILGLAVVARMPKARVLVPAAVFWALGVVLKAAIFSLARGAS
jgi:Yip1 domain